MKIAALILAAGGSTRLGQPKQLLRYEGRTLVRRAVEAALDGGCSPVFGVVGRDRGEIAAELRGLPVKLLPNDQWDRGIGTSIRAGVSELAECDGVLILASDQPHVNASLIAKIIAEHERTKKPMVASSYAGTVGVPALFASAYFEELLSLGDDVGAKSLLLAQPNEVVLVDFPEGVVDLDTPEDYFNLIGRRQRSS